MYIAVHMIDKWYNLNYYRGNDKKIKSYYRENDKKSIWYVIKNKRGEVIYGVVSLCLYFPLQWMGRICLFLPTTK